MTSSISVEARQYLSIDSLIQGLRERFEAIPDPRRAASIDHSLADCLMAAFAMFSLKEPSLLAFDQRRQDQSLMNLYRINSIPSDTQHREILDQVDPKHLNECMNALQTSSTNFSGAACSRISCFRMASICWSLMERAVFRQLRFDAHSV